MSNECMLTTFDNPHNPFDDFTSWFMFDVEKGYYTWSHIARILDLIGITDDMAQIEKDEAIEAAIDSIIDNDILNIYKKIYKNNTEQTKNNT